MSMAFMMNKLIALKIPRHVRFKEEPTIIFIESDNIGRKVNKKSNRQKLHEYLLKNYGNEPRREQTCEEFLAWHRGKFQ